MTRTRTTEPRERAAGAIRSVADNLEEWSGGHEHSGLADHASAWARQTAARVEDDAVRQLAYEARRRARRPEWTVAFTILAGGLVVGGVVAWTLGRKQRSRRNVQEQSLQESLRSDSQG